MTEPRQDSAADRHDARDTDRAATQVRHQLEQRGVRMHDDDDPAAIADVLSAVEQFERAVARRGGDSFTNAPQSSDPDRDEYVIPSRRDDEDAESYARRVRARADELGPGGR